jgi:hypothetical protein
MPAVPSDPVYTQPAEWSGREGSTTEPFDSRAEANGFAAELAGGLLDPFLGRAYTEIYVDQNRNPDGTFAPGFTVTIDFVRPGPGEMS